MMEIAVRSLCKRLRLSLSLSQEAFARKLSLTKGAVQHWEAGRGGPTVEHLKTMKKLAPQFAAELDVEIARPRLPHGERRGDQMNRAGFISIKTNGRRYAEDTISSAHGALDLVLDNAPTEIVKKVQALLDKHAEQWKQK